jgi:A/G-specific adenine glycosylase
VSLHRGVFPDKFESLLKLPGIGEYTAAAIASFSFQEPVAVVDGNVFRVLSRVFGVEHEINSPEGKRVFATLANSLLNKNFPDGHNQAIMEFGALHCVPKKPACPSCPFLSGCFAAQQNLQAVLPRKAKLKTSRKRYFYYIVIQRGRSLLMKPRIEKDIWNSLFDFPLLEKKKLLKHEELLLALLGHFAIDLKNAAVEISKHYKHILTHQTIHARFIMIKTGKFPPPKDKKLKFYTFEKINDLPKPVLISKFLVDYKNFYS